MANSDDPVTRYEGKEADVFWDSRLCIHVAECGRAAGVLFVGGRKPWCQPDGVGLDEVVDVVQRCPSGALTYRRADGRSEEAPDENVIVVSNNGPLFVRGDLRIDGADDDLPGVRFRAALCRCGLSKRKPFCDNSHEAAEFRDRGAVGETGSGFESSGGPLEIKPTANGPYLVRGNVTVVASSGRVAWRGTKAALCRCGQSKNKPFCDGSHKRTGFRSE